jgi:hypothetical protein
VAPEALRTGVLLAACAAAAACRALPAAKPAADSQASTDEAGAAEALAFQKYGPSGYARGGPAPGLADGDEEKRMVPVKDRWRVGFPDQDRGTGSDAPQDRGAWWDPYHQHLLKGDYPIPGTQNTFLVVEGVGTALFEARRTPTPSGVFPKGGGGIPFFRDGEETLLDERFDLSIDLFHGETSYRPVDWRVLVRGVFDANHAGAEENTVLFADPSKGTDRDDRFGALQEAFLETTLATVSPDYDVIQARVGIQRFNADFRGFLFLDDAPGVRVFGSLDDNRWQWNVALFDRRDKDTNSGLNDFERIGQRLLVVNVYRQDILEDLAPAGRERSWSRGLTAQAIFAHFSDEASVDYDSNGFLVRPRPVGLIRPNHRRIDYLGANLDGHVGRVNVVGSLYHASGDVSFDEIAGRDQTVDAGMAALELSMDRDWMRFKVFGFYQSGDGDPLDGDAEGFDAVFDNPNFAGGEFGFWNRNAVRLAGTGVGLVQRGSLLNTLRSSKDQGSPSYVNPGLLLAGVGWDGQLTPKLKVLTNVSYLAFDDTSSLEQVLNQSSIGPEIGWDVSVGAIWRPLLSENVVVKGGVAALIPGHGFRDVFTGEVLYTGFVELELRW